MKKALLLIFTLVAVSMYSQEVMMQEGQVDTCTGTFTDSGGAGGNYGSNENFTLTICPDVPGNMVQLNFTQFSTQLGVDTMTIFNGPDTMATQLGGNYDGANSPGFVTATPAINPSGCLTIVFTSDGAGTTTGWSADIACSEPCQTIVAEIDSTIPAISADESIKVCQGEEISFTGTATFSSDPTGATYAWDFGDNTTADGQTVTHSYDTAGVYLVNLVVTDDNTTDDPDGCSSSNIINQIVQVSTEPDFSMTQAADDSLCFGETTTIEGVATATEFIFDCTPATGQETSLPDGNGVSYTSGTIVENCYADTEVIVDGDQIAEVCLNIEHSYSGDLDIFLESPNGVQVQLFAQAGGGIYFGGADNNDNGVPGVGADYCFSNAGTILLEDANTITAGSNPPNNSWEPGTYLPIGNFDDFIGSPINGDWTIIITDNIPIDDGTIFFWSIDFDPALQPPLLSFTPVIESEAWDPDPTITDVTGNTITVAPPTAGTYCYTYRVVDDFGCEYTEEVCITMEEEITADVASVVNPICQGDDAEFSITATPNSTISYTLNGGAVQTEVIDATGTWTFTVASAMVDQTFNLIDVTLGDCTVTLNDIETIIVGQVFDTSFTLTATCDGATATVLGDVGGVFAFADPQPTDGAMIDSATGTITNGTSGATYTVVYEFVSSCTPGDSESVTVLPSADSSFTLTPTCDGATASVTGDAGGTFAFNPLPADGAVIDMTTGAITNAVSNVTYTVEYLVPGACSSVTTETVTVLPAEDASFTLTATCEGATAVITGDIGGSFAFNPLPMDGATIDGATGLVTGVSATTYTVEYTTSGPCPETSTETVTVLPSEDASFSYTSNCSGAVATIIGNVGGTFIFNPVPTDGAVIDAATGEITNGTAGTTYTVEYTTSGSCAESSTQTVTVFIEDDSSFSLTATCDGAFATITGLPGGTFAFNPVPTDGAIIDPATGAVTNAPFDTSYTVEYTTNGTCPTTSTQSFTVLSQPVIIDPTPLEVCDDGVPDGLTAIDLTIKNGEVTGGDTTYSVSYHLTQFDADNALGPLPIPYTNTVNGQVVYVRVQDIVTGCYATTTLELIVEQAPVANTPVPLEYCDADSDGFGVFTLSDADNGVTGGDPTLTVSYHETMADADNNVNALTSPYNNIVEGQQTVYVRVESATIATDCATVVELVLMVHQTPQIEDPTPLEVCDDVSADGFAQFDLTSKDAEILDGLDPLQYLVTYYEVEANAESGTGPILVPTGYTNTTAFNQTLWVRVEDTVNGCHKLTTLDLVVNALPVLIQPAPLELCDDNNPGDEVEAFTLEDANAEMLGGQTGISFTYYETQLDADSGTDPIVSPYMNTSNPQTVFVRATDDVTGCWVSTTATILLRVNPIPSPAAPTDLEVCDLDNDGFEEFDLESRTLEVINGELDIAITYHETQSDAEMGLNALASPYTNIVMDEQLIYIRAENTVTGCYNALETLTIRVLPSPVVPVEIGDYVVCDTDSDGFAQFDLTTKDAEVLGGQDASEFMLTYHVSQADAESGSNPIANVTNYTNINNPQTIYVRLESGVNGCVTATGLFEIRVELPPVAVQPTPLEFCDDEVADEVTVFDLTVKDLEITGGEASWSVSYYETDADAQSGTGAVDATSYGNTSVNGAPANPQTLYVVVTDTDTGCVDYTTLTIRVLPNPTPSLDPSDLELCDDINPGDMEEVFDLTENEVYIINGESGVTATYHETEEDAELGENAIADPTAYGNTSTPQTIHVRVTNDVTGCYTLVSFDIVVNPLPAVIPVTDFILCELDTDGFDGFDLELKDGEILNGQDASLFTVTYHATQSDADDLMNPLVSPYTNTSNPQQIFVAITNNVTGCSISTPSFNIEVQEAAEANSGMEPITYVICDDEMDDDNDLSNNSAQFDLTPVEDIADLDPLSVQAQVLDGQDPASYIVSYYETEEGAEQGVDPLPFLYENLTNPQVIYVRVDNDTMVDDGMGNMVDSSICYAVAELTLQVDPLPVFDLDDSYILCVGTNGTEVLGAPILDTGLDAAFYGFTWSLNGAEIPGATGSIYMPTEGGAYTVVVEDLATGCTSGDIAEVIESGPPMVTAVVTTEAFAETHVIEVIVDGDISQYEYSLDGGPWQDEPIFTGVSIGEHEVTARDRDGCGQASDKVTVMDYPAFFTPNGDGYNDTWNISLPESVGLSTKIYIFDRYGKLLKQISPLGEGWDGTYNGTAMPTSDYWFVVEYSEPATLQQKEFKAHFTLKR